MRKTIIVRTDRIECPRCRILNEAVVTQDDGDPWPSFVHTCERCGYIIMESEWQEVEEEQAS